MRRMAASCAIVGLLLLASGCGAAGDRAMHAAMQGYGVRMSPDLAAAPLTTAEGQLIRTDAANDPVNWLAWADPETAKPETEQGDGASARPAAGLKAASWRERRGPAYPGDFWRSFGRYWLDLPATVWDDTVATATNPWSLAGIGAAGAAGIAVSGSGADRCVGDHYTKRGPQLSHFGDMVGDIGGNPGTHFAIAGAMLLTSMAANDVEHYEKSRSLINALAINGVVTLGLKGLARTDSPNRDPFGWPSGHTSSTFCFAMVMHEHYGPLAGIPLFALATFVGYERVDARNHDLSDVVSGALLGIAIGHAVASNHKIKFLGMDVVPYVDPRGGVGLGLAKRW